MKKRITSSALRVTTGTVLLVAVLAISGCHDQDVCTTCEAAYHDEKKVSLITHYDDTNTLREKYYFQYSGQLLESIRKVVYGDPEARIKSTDSIETILQVFYPSGQCIPSHYEMRTYVPGSPTPLERGFLALSGDVIANKHLAFYEDETIPVADHTAEIDYVYNLSDQVTARNGTDYGILVWPHLYGNENTYSYTGSNITGISAWKEQAGYDLEKAFDTRNNPFAIQSGIMYYLNLIAYTDQEYFETISKDHNNPTSIVYTGTDTSNSFVTITFTFTYSYDADDYPVKVAVYEEEENEVYGDSETDHGTYLFQYY